MNHLRFTYEPEDKWHGVLHVHVKSETYAGKSSAWFTLADLRDFGLRLNEYPIAKQSAPTLVGGYYSDGGPEIKQAHVSIRIVPFNSTGTLLVEVDLATPVQTTDQDDMRHAVSVKFKSEYADLARLHRLFLNILDDGPSEALWEV